MKKKTGSLIFFLLIVLGILGYYYYNNIYVFRFVDKERILNDNFEIDETTSDSVSFTEKGLGYNYILKTFTLQKIKDDIKVKSSFLISESMYQKTGYDEIHKDDDIIVYLKIENSANYNYRINKYVKEKEVFIQVNYVSEEKILDYKIDNLVSEAESYLKY